MRLIDADALRNKLQAEIDKVNPPFDGVLGTIRCGVRLARNMVEDEPTVDAVEVVRCKDCKHKQGSACDYSAVWVRPNGFCQWGERKDDE